MTEHSKVYTFFLYFFAVIGLLSTFAAVLGGVITYQFVHVLRSSSVQPTPTSTTTTKTTGTTGKNTIESSLTDQQKNLLKTVGIDPATLPSTITPQMEACLKTAWGTDRYNQIAATHETPSSYELYKAKSCL